MFGDKVGCEGIGRFAIDFKRLCILRHIAVLHQTDQARKRHSLKLSVGCIAVGEQLIHRRFKCKVLASSRVLLNANNPTGGFQYFAFCPLIPMFPVMVVSLMPTIKSFS